MAKEKKDIKKSPNFIKVVSDILIAIGTPFLFAIKILLWTIVWLGKLGITILSGLWAIFVGIGEVFLWGVKTIWIAFIFLFGKKFKSSLLQTFHSKRTRISEIVIKERRKRFSLPQIKLPSWRLELEYHNLVLVLLGLILAIPLVIVPYWIKSQLDLLPDPKLLTLREISVSTKIYDRNGVLLYQIYSDENRSIVKLSELPKYVVEATIATEDKNFYHHIGFDLFGIIRAAFANSNGTISQGGSTITQQLVKSALLTPERTLGRKIKELVLAFWAERIYSKQQILEMYLNQVPYGGAAYGIEEAAKIYFKKKATDLTLSEAALLAGLPSAPSVYSPYGTHPELARERQKQTLTAMVSQNFITSFQAETAEKEELKYGGQEISIKAPHFVMYVKEYLTQKYGERRVDRGGLEVITSLDYGLYETLTKMVKDGVEKQKYLRVGNGAALVTNPMTGEILAMIGSTDFFDLTHDGNVNVALANRSPGSSIKPLNYALAMERGLITPATVIDDSPVVYRTSGQAPYSPGNYDGRFHGKVTARVALASSYNIPAVKVLEKNGMTNFIDFARKAGITTFIDPSRYGLALTLGGGEVKMTDMATAFSIFANGGEKVDLKPILSVKDYKGNVLEDNRDTGHKTQDSGRIISPQTAFLINTILADDGARAPTFGAGSILNVSGHTVSVKTGTAETKKDNWTIGYSFGDQPRLVAVWVGNNDNSPMSPFLESGNTGAAAIWNPIMSFALKDQPNSPIPRPDDIIPVQICAMTGTLTCENCPRTITEYFKKGTEPKVACKISKEESEELVTK